MAALETFFDAWGETDAAKRRDMIASAIADAFIYSDPRAPEPLTGLDALSDYVGQFSANAPGWTASVAAQDSHNGFTRATVAFGGKGPDGADMVQNGTYFTVIDGDGKLTILAGFMGTGAPE